MFFYLQCDRQHAFKTTKIRQNHNKICLNIFSEVLQNSAAATPGQGFALMLIAFIIDNSLVMERCTFRLQLKEDSL